MRFSKNPPVIRATPRCLASHRAMLLAPAKDAFDHFAALLRHAIARVPCRAGIDRASPPLADFGRAIVLRHMRRDVDGTQVFNMALRIIGLVRACRDAMTNGLALGFQHGFRSAPFRRAIGLCDDPCHRKPVPVLHGDMTHVAEPRLPPRRLAIETALRIGRARMRLVRAFLAAKIRAISFIVAAVLGPKALLRCPGLDQSPIHRKMLVRQKRLHLRVIQKLRHELLKHLAVLQSSPVLGESRRVPHRVVAQARRTSDTKDYSRAVPSAGVPSGCRRTPGAARRSAIAPVGSRGGPRLNRAVRSWGSGLSDPPDPAPFPAAKDASPAPAPQETNRKTIRPDPEIVRA